MKKPDRQMKMKLLYSLILALLVSSCGLGEKIILSRYLIQLL
ncbi:hypothetical protein [Chryseobacterium indologenes]|nr:hypothetical protein [Chryseobacterium indologenes]